MTEQGGAPTAPAVTVAPSVRYAGFWLRWVACVIDGILLGVPLSIFVLMGVMAGILSAGHDPSPAGMLFLFLLIPFAFAVSWLYSAGMESSSAQGTVGKRILGLRVTDETGRRISFARATGRHFAKILSGIPFNIGYIMAAFTEQKRALHDMVAKTLVVRASS